MTASIGSRARLVVAVWFVVLAAIAWVSPAPDHVTDRGLYEATAQHIIVPDCSDLQCFRVLVPWVVGRFPGASGLRWKAYAALSNAAAAAGVLLLCLSLGMSRRVAWLASAISALGFGSLYTLHDPYTSDPLMFAMGPLLTNELLVGRLTLAAGLAVVGVLAKEFAAAPLYAFALYAAAERRWLIAARVVAAGNAAFIMWAMVTLTLMLRFHYTWGWNGVGSANLTGGAALALWAGRQSAQGIAFAMFNEFGALYVLAPVGLLFASSSLRRLVIVTLPIAAVFAYVQQPDRALWNFHYLVAPLAALVLERVPAALAWGVIALFAIGNLRVGAQLPVAAVAHAAIAGSLLLACASVGMALRSPDGGRAHSVPVSAVLR